MAKKEVKTNAMRILDKHKVAYRTKTYACDEFIDGIHVADKNGDSYDQSFKTLVAVGKTGAHYVFVIPVDREIDFKKAARLVGEKAVELIPVKDINSVTGYIRGGCTPLGMKKLYPTVIQESAKAFDEIIISGGKLGMQILINPLDLAEVIGGSFGDIIVGENS
ncbi:MAG: Cys-tRNA(Pro) deacylase [Bacteroidales bacterium]|nr:Cys-tRNA(Pro) deacylase [Clostridium sp.]MCM1203471.1 Cys-tRNA(Pro) deacylase [Bacteroidales bacterium]